MNKKPLKFLIFFTLISEIITLFLITSEKSDLENQFFMGFSKYRWVMIIFVLILVLVSVASFILINQKHKSYEKILNYLSHKCGIFSMISLVFFILLMSLFILLSWSLFPEIEFLLRIRPILILMILISGGFIFYLFFEFKNIPLQWIKNLVRSYCQKLFIILEKFKALISSLLSSKWILPLLMLSTFPLIFYAAIKYQYPTGYAGLFTLMTEGIIDNNFKLPNIVPFYGPGGIPFAYPPVGFYLFAIFIKLFNVPALAYLRFAPPAFLWLSIIPIYYFTLHLSKSKIATILAPIIILGSQRIFMVQGTAAGIVRGLAFLLAMTAIYFFVKSMDSTEKIWNSILAGVLIGLTVLTHFSYALFVLFCVVSYGLTHFYKKNVLLKTMLSGFVSIATILPWVLTLSKRYGWDIFLYAFRSHGNDQFLSYAWEIEMLIPWIENSMRPIFSYQFFWGIILLALIYVFFTKQRFLTVWFIFVLLFSSESDRFLISIAAIIVGILVDVIFTNLNQDLKVEKLNWNQILFFSVILVIFYRFGWMTISSGNKPVINDKTLELADYIRTQTPSQLTYLVVAEAEEAEWYPYLLRREPVIASWGGEWIGNYSQHLEWVYNVARCKHDDSLTCLDQLIDSIPEKPNILITQEDCNKINSNLSSAGLWEQIFKNDQYRVWKSIE
jgi:hypothetical protein